MTILELVKQLDTLSVDYKRQVRDLPKNYVRGSEMMKVASEQMRTNYEIYAYQIACLNTLEKHGLITEDEYKKFKKFIQKKYKIIDGIEACTT